MGAHMRNYTHNHHPHMPTIRNLPSTPPLVTSMQQQHDIVDSATAHKDRCTSAESSSTTCSIAETLNSPEPNSALIKPVNNHSFALISDNCSFNPKPKRPATSRDAINDCCIRPGGANYCRNCTADHRNGPNEELVCANEAVKISGGVPLGAHCAGICAAIKVQADLRVCCMCGDAGIAGLLFICSKCSRRHQHIYCSRSYPNMGDEASICNWCLHEEDSIISTVTKASADTNTNKVVRASATPVTGVECHGHPRGTNGEFGNHILENEEVMVQKGHSKAFEYLLLVAEQSLPQETRAISSGNLVIKQEKHVSSTINSNRGSLAIRKVSGDPESIKANATPLVNIVNVGPHQLEGKSNSSPHSNKLSMRLGTHQNMRIHSQVKITIEQKDVDVGRLIGGTIPKRQRCNKGINASLKCRKKGLQLSPSRPNYRRYKLLADVVC